MQSITITSAIVIWLTSRHYRKTGKTVITPRFYLAHYVTDSIADAKETALAEAQEGHGAPANAEANAYTFSVPLLPGFVK